MEHEYARAMKAISRIKADIARKEQRPVKEKEVASPRRPPASTPTRESRDKASFGDCLVALIPLVNVGFIWIAVFCGQPRRARRILVWGLLSHLLLWGVLLSNRGIVDWEWFTTQAVVGGLWYIGLTFWASRKYKASTHDTTNCEANESPGGVAEFLSQASTHSASVCESKTASARTEAKGTEHRQEVEKEGAPPIELACTIPDDSDEHGDTIWDQEVGPSASALNDPNLTMLVQSWPELPEAIRSGIIAMVKTVRVAAPEGESQRPSSANRVFRGPRP